MISDNEFGSKIGRFIRLLRNQKNYSIEELASYSELDYSSLNKIENSKQKPSAYTLYKILYALDLDLMQILNKSEIKTSDLLLRIEQKLSLMTENQLLAIYGFLDNFEITKKRRKRATK